MKFNLFTDKVALNIAGANLFQQEAIRAVEEKGSFWVCLSGGNTPEQMFKLLTKEPYRNEIPWQNIHFFWGDERCVPLDAKENNAANAFKTLLDHVPAPALQIYRIQSDLEPATAAREYETTLQRFFGDRLPAFDILFLGMGDDGHTASLFPHTSVLEEKQAWVKEVYIKKLEAFRVTMTPLIINQAKKIVFLIAGASKVTALEQVLRGPYQPEEYPSQLVVRHHEKVEFYLDKEAGEAIVKSVS